MEKDPLVERIDLMWEVIQAAEAFIRPLINSPSIMVANTPKAKTLLDALKRLEEYQFQ